MAEIVRPMQGGGCCTNVACHKIPQLTQAFADNRMEMSGFRRKARRGWLIRCVLPESSMVPPGDSGEGDRQGA